MRLEVAFYNEKLSVWESLVEPVVENGKMKKWDLGLQVGNTEWDLGLQIGLYHLVRSGSLGRCK